MNRIKAVELIIKRHKDKALIYAQLSNYHADKAKEFESYKYELTKPGFKSNGWCRMSKQGRVENYVIQAGDTST